MSMAVDVKDMLEADSALGLKLADNLFIGRMPAKPNNVVVIFDTPAYPPQLTFNPLERYEYSSVQIQVRNTSYVTAEAIAKQIQQSLHGRYQETWNDSIYTIVQCSTPPALLDWDDSNRARFYINFDSQTVRKE